MPKKTPKPLSELDKRTNPMIVKQAKENALRENELDKARKEKLLKINDVDDENKVD